MHDVKFLEGGHAKESLPRRYVRQQHQPNPPKLAEKVVRLKVSDFHGKMNLETFLDWMSSIESFFVWHQLIKARKFSSR